MTNSTSQKNLLRISFLERDDEKSQVEIVCLIRLIDEGLEINYVQHIYRGRDRSTAPWVEERSRIPLTPSMISLIHSGVMHQLWSKFVTKVVFAPMELLSKAPE